MPSKKPAAPSLQRILDRIDGQGGLIEDVRRESLTAIAATRVAIEGRMDFLDLRIHAQSVHLGDMRSLNRLTIEAVEAARLVLEERIRALDRETRSRDAALEPAIRDLKVSVQQNTNDIRDLAGRMEALTHLEQRVSALERRLA